jgi:uncharacterized protein (DUF927 family)
MSESKVVGFPVKQDNDNKQSQHAGDQTERLNFLYQWADGALEAAGLLKLLRDAKTLKELDAIKFEPGNLTLIVMIRDAVHPGTGKSRDKHFRHLTEKMLENILRARFNQYKKEQREKLIAGEQQTAAEEEAREKREEDVKFYGEFGQYKVRDCGVFVRTEEEIWPGVSLTKWVQISRTRIELLAVTRSKEDDNWGIYIKIVNMDGHVTRLAIPRSVINDMQGTIAGRLANLGADIVRDERNRLPDFLLTTVMVVDDQVEELPHFMAVPTTGWYRLNNGRWVIVLPHTTKFPADIPAGEFAIFQNENLHLKHGFASEGTIEEWREQILEPFAGNSNVTLAVGTALSGPLTVRAGVPPGMFHIFAKSKHGKSLASAIGQSIYGRPLIPNEANADPFGMSWLATANHLGELILVRSSIGAFVEELNQGKARDIADAAYRIANGISKGRLRGRKPEPRLTYSVVGVSTGEAAMVDFLSRNGQEVTDGMRTRFADIPGDVQEGSVFEQFSKDQVPALGKQFYALLGTLYGAVGDAWLQYLVDLGPEQITATVNRYQEEFLARPKVQALYAIAAPYQRSVIDRFATVAAACCMGIEAGLLWQNVDTDTDIEACITRWAEHERMDTAVVAIAHFMDGRQSWQGTASELINQLNGAIDSARALGWWLKKSENLRRLKLSGFEVRKGKSKGHDRSRLIRIERVGRSDVSDGVLATGSAPTTEVRVRRSHRTRSHRTRRTGRHKVHLKRPNVRKRHNRRRSNG